MNKSDLIDTISRRCSNHIKRCDVKEVVDLTIKLIESALISGESVTLHQFGTFAVQESKRGKVELVFHSSPSLTRALNESDERLAG